LFGEHTFFLDQHGLNIVEPVAAAEPAAERAKVVNLATPRQRARVLAETAGSGASPLDWFSSLSWSRAFIGSSSA
jgi:hypothetical protein